MANRKTVEVTRGKGKNKNQFRFMPKASNGKKLSDRDFYKRKATLVRMLKKNFPDFEIVDLT